MSRPHLHILFSRETIASRIRSLAQEISGDYQGREPILIGVLNGAFVFLADLIRELSIPVQVDFLRVASYGSSTDSAGIVRFTKDLELPLDGRDLLVVEDIVDTGRTLQYLLETLKQRGPRSVRICVLLDKRHRREVALSIDYVGFVIEEGFVVGYGLDCAEAYRHLPDLCILETGEEASPGREMNLQCSCVRGKGHDH